MGSVRADVRVLPVCMLLQSIGHVLNLYSLNIFTENIILYTVVVKTAEFTEQTRGVV